MKSQYLGEQFIAFYPRLAVLVGSVHRALVLQKLSDLLEFFEKVGDPDSDHWIQRYEGRVWYRSSYAHMVEQFFPWLTVHGLKKHVYWLRDAGYLLLRGGWREGLVFRREVWLTVDYEFLDVALEAIEDANSRAKCENGTTQVPKAHYPSAEMARTESEKGTIQVSKSHDSLGVDSINTIPETLSSSSPRQADNGVPDGDETDDDYRRWVAIHNDGWVTAIDEYGDSRLVQVSTERLAEECQQVRSLLEKHFVKGKALDDLPGRCTVYQVTGWEAYLRQNKKRNEGGFLVQVLGQGDFPPKTTDQERREENRTHWRLMLEDEEYAYQYCKKWGIEGNARLDAEVEQARKEAGDESAD